MKLLFAIKTLQIPGGGAERVLAAVTGALAERGHHVAVASFDGAGDQPFYPLPPAVKRVALGIGDVRGGTGPGEMLHRMKALRRLTQRDRPDVAIGFMHSAYLPLGLALTGTGVPLLASEHTAADHYRDKPVQRMLLRFTPFVAEAITVVSEAIRAGFPERLQRRMVVIPNPVAAPDDRADVAGPANGPKTVLSVGSLVELKDQAVLIDAFAQLASAFPDWRLRIVGEGPLRPSLEQQVRTLGLQDRVVLPGTTPDIAQEYRAAQLFVLPSRYESFGLATAEAMTFKLPAIGFADCPGTNALIVDGRNGLLAAGPSRTDALAEAMARLMSAPDLRARLGETGAADMEPYSIQAIAPAWESLLERLCRR